MKNILLKIWGLVKNYYIIATLAFIVWISFFDTDNLVSQYAQRKEMNQLMQQKKFYTSEIQRMKNLSEALTTDMSAMEQYGRENYLMKRPGEDIYLVVTQEQKKDN